jgi:hypothetical protein
VFSSFVSELKVSTTYEGGFPLTLSWRRENGGPVSVSMATALGCAAGTAKSILSADAAPLGPKSVGAETTPRANARRTTTTTTSAPPATTACTPPAAAAAPPPSPAAAAATPPSPATPVDWLAILGGLLAALGVTGASVVTLLKRCMDNQKRKKENARTVVGVVMGVCAQLTRELNVSSCCSLSIPVKDLDAVTCTCRRVGPRLRRRGRPRRGLTTPSRSGLRVRLSTLRRRLHHLRQLPSTHLHLHLHLLRGRRRRTPGGRSLPSSPRRRGWGSTPRCPRASTPTATPPRGI